MHGGGGRVQPDPALPTLAATALGIAFALCLPAIAGLSNQFQRVEFYGHGYLVFLVAAYLVYDERKQIAETLRCLRPPRYGFLLVFAAAAFEVLMLIGDVTFLAGVGVSLLLASTLYAVGGSRLVEPFRLPLVLVVLMTPPPGFVRFEILSQLKLLVTKSAVWLLQIWGAPVFREGNVVVVPGHTLFVADACSGLTSILTMLPIAVVLAYFIVRSNWRRAILVLSVMPLALAANVIRLIVTVQMVSVIGGEAAQGALHESFGIGVYAAGSLLLLGLARLLR